MPNNIPGPCGVAHPHGAKADKHYIVNLPKDSRDTDRLQAIYMWRRITFEEEPLNEEVRGGTQSGEESTLGVQPGNG
jgi:hypothetical protein